jgi:hypothetical protein
MTVSSLSICLALKKIADITCGTRRDAIQVKVIDPWNEVLSVSLPSQYQLPISTYLTQHIGFSNPSRNTPCC